MSIGPVDPMRTSATDNGHVDAFAAARMLAVIRDRRRRAASRVEAEIDLGEPGRPLVTIAFVALAVVATIAEFSRYGASPSSPELARFGGASIGAVATGEWWKLVTANLLHGDIMHVAFNSVMLVVIGRWLEHLVGRRVLLAAVLVSAVTSMVGALLQAPASVTIGASGVAFGMLGCAVASDPRARTAVGVVSRPLVVLNVIFTFLMPGVSIGGHVGGLIGGLLVGAIAFRRRPEEGHPAGRPRPIAVAVLLAVGALAIGTLLAGPSVLPGEARELRGRIVAPLAERRAEAIAESNDLKSPSVACDHTDDPTRYDCELDGSPFVAVVTPGSDEWSAESPAG